MAKFALARINEFHLPTLVNRTGLMKVTKPSSGPCVPSASWSRPRSSLSSIVMEEKSPLGVDALYVLVSDEGSFEWIYDSNTRFLKLDFGANPKEVNNERKSNGCKNIGNGKVISWIKNHLNQVREQRQVSKNSKNQVAFRSYNLTRFHNSILPESGN
jgi:hypothetical protein